MPKKKAEKSQYRFRTGGNLADGTRFEAGEDVPSSLTEAELAALAELDAIETVEGAE